MKIKHLLAVFCIGMIALMASTNVIAPPPLSAGPSDSFELHVLGDRYSSAVLFRPFTLTFYGSGDITGPWSDKSIQGTMRFIVTNPRGRIVNSQTKKVTLYKTGYGCGKTYKLHYYHYFTYTPGNLGTHNYQCTLTLPNGKTYTKKGTFMGVYRGYSSTRTWWYDYSGNRQYVRYDGGGAGSTSIWYELVGNTWKML
ncbi:MAG: hypothetical protein JW724_04210 [Candidatus Altiarchaeota archaeon]|nr:hypothetical protein [Candidatus Altiarchaeota archaeon]